jgi:hypothetical protein
LGLAVSSAYPYPIGVTPTVTATPGVLTPGQQFTANADHFCPGEDVEFYVDNVFKGTDQADANGAASLLVNAPAVEGTFEVRAQAPNCDGTPSDGPRRVVHLAPAGGNGVPLDVARTTIVVEDGLPNTGSDVDVPLRAGIIVFLSGAGLAVVAAKRRRSAAQA